MAKLSLRRFRPIGLTALLGLASMVAAQDMAYCASFNTADGDSTMSDFQSDGLCYNTCNGKSAFAVVQGKNCWCTDYVPASSVRVSTGDCSDPCPGFPDDTCGGKGLWGYMQLAKKPAGTKGGDDSKPSATPKPQDPVTETVQNTVTLTPSTHDQNTPTTKPAPISESPDKPTTKAPTETPQPSTLVSTITQDGGVSLATVTVFPTSPTTSSGANKADVQEGEGSGGLSAGAAAGVAVGVIGFFLILGGIAAFLWFRRRQSRQQTMMDHQNSVRGSSAGMMSTPRTEMASVWDGDSMGRRNSRFMPHDPRMDPFAPNIYGRFDNKSHESVNTLRDDQDYSRRVLRTTNPDPDNA